MRASTRNCRFYEQHESRADDAQTVEYVQIFALAEQCQHDAAIVTESSLINLKRKRTSKMCVYLSTKSYVVAFAPCAVKCCDCIQRCWLIAAV